MTSSDAGVTPASSGASRTGVPPGTPGVARRRPVLETCARVAGAVLGAASALVGRVRARPLHPDGLVLAGRLHRLGAPDGRASGVAWLDSRGADDVVVRLSRGGGLPSWLPDVHGVALSGPDGDLLLSTAAGGSPGLRHVPFPRWRHATTLYSSLVSFQGPDGPVMIGARPRPPRRRLARDASALAAELRRVPLVLDLVWATPSSRWQHCGALAIMATAGAEDDVTTRFDPLRTPPGLRTRRWVREVRAPAYTAARHDAATKAAQDAVGARRTA